VQKNKLETIRTETGIEIRYDGGYWFKLPDPARYHLEPTVFIIQDQELVAEMRQCWGTREIPRKGMSSLTGRTFRPGVFNSVRDKIVKNLKPYETAKGRWQWAIPSSPPNTKTESGEMIFNWFYIELIPDVLYECLYWEKNKKKIDGLTDNAGGYLVARHAEQEGKKDAEIIEQVKEIMKEHIETIQASCPNAVMLRGFPQWCYNLQHDIGEIVQALKTPYLTAGIIADEVGLSRQQVNNLAPKIPGAYQVEKGGFWMIPYTAIKHLKNTPRPKTGRPKSVKKSQDEFSSWQT
jgi:hypothetical protein